MSRLFLLILFAHPIISFAQVTEKQMAKHLEKIEKSRIKNSVEISLDTLYYAGSPYCLFVEGKKIMGNIMDITVKDLDGHDAMWCKLVTGSEINRPDIVTAYDITFVNSGNKALFTNVIGNSLAKEIVKRELFSQLQINSEAEKKFISFNSLSGVYQGYGNPSPPQNHSNYPKLVDRNRNQMIQIFGEEIKQDFKIIGKVTESRQATGGNILIVLQFYLPDGSLVGMAQNEDAMSNSWILVTSKDNKTHYLQSSLGNDKLDLAKFLVQKLYL